jgi:hypothetical protein
MSKKKVSQVNKEVESEERAEMERVSKEVQEVLERNGYAIQPFMQFSEYGVVPRARLVKVPKDEGNSTNSNNNDEQATNTGEAVEPEVEDGATESK